MMEIERTIVRLEHWSFTDPAGCFKVPEEISHDKGRGLYAQGCAYGHPNYPHILNGEPVTTTRIQAMVPSQNLVKTRNTIYKLGVPSERFKRFMEDSRLTIADYSWALITKGEAVSQDELENLQGPPEGFA